MSFSPSDSLKLIAKGQESISTDSSALDAIRVKGISNANTLLPCLLAKKKTERSRLLDGIFYVSFFPYRSLASSFTLFFSFCGKVGAEFFF